MRITLIIERSVRLKTPLASKLHFEWNFFWRQRDSLNYHRLRFLQMRNVYTDKWDAVTVTNKFVFCICICPVTRSIKATLNMNAMFTSHAHSKFTLLLTQNVQACHRFELELIRRAEHNSWTWMPAKLWCLPIQVNLLYYIGSVLEVGAYSSYHSKAIYNRPGQFKYLSVINNSVSTGVNLDLVQYTFRLTTEINWGEFNNWCVKALVKFSRVV